MRKAFAAAFVLLALICSPARAQFDAQQTFVQSSGGTGTAITVLLANVSQLSDLTGVPVCVLMSQSVTGPATLQVNSLAPVAIQKPTAAGLAALANGDVVNAQTACFKYDGTVFELGPPNLNLTTVQASSGFTEAINLQLNCTAAANALTCAIKAANTGGDPSSLAPVYIPFADGTTTAGDPVWKTITSATSFTFAGGNTAGCSSGAPCRLWITAVNDTTAITGAVRVGLSNQSTANSCFSLNEGILQSTGSGTSGGSSAGTVYTSASSLSGMAIRILGYVEWTTLATAGNWTSPNFVRLFGPGIKKPCEIIQSINNPFNTLANTTNTYVPSATLPTPSNSLSIVSQAITPNSAANIVRVTGQAVLTQASVSTSQFTTYIYDTTNSVVRAVALGMVPSANTGVTLPVNWQGIPGVTTSITYTLYGTSSGGSSTYVNGNGATQYFGSASNTFLRVEEIQGALEPANDNLEPLSKVG